MSSPLAGTSIIGFSRGTGAAPAGRGVNPATGATLDPEFRAATADEIEQTCELAASAFPRFAALKSKARATFLRRIAENIEALGDPLLERMNAESALPPARCVAERARTCAQLQMFAEVVEDGSWVDARIDTALPERQPMPKPDLRSMLRPSGPVAIFCAGNFPLAFSVAGGDTASALAAGCPVVVNAHSGHPGTAELTGTAIVQAARQSGLPDGVFSLLYGAGFEVGQALVKHPAIRGVGFTGSRKGGRALMDLAAARREPIPVYAEMSSVNPIFILPAALRERWGAIAAGLYASVSTGVGQFCTKPGLIFLPVGKEADQFIEKFKALFAETPFCPMLNAGIHDNFLMKRERLTGVASVQLLAEGAGAQAGVFVTTAQAFLENGLLHEEVFGPTTLVILCDGEHHLLACAAALEGQLTATVHAGADDHPIVSQLTAILPEKAGRLVFNGFPTGVEVCHSMVHGGPYPATSDGRTTSVGSAAITRWTRAVCYQSLPAAFLPAALKDENPLRLWRLVNGERKRG